MKWKKELLKFRLWHKSFLFRIAACQGYDNSYQSNLSWKVLMENDLNLDFKSCCPLIFVWWGTSMTSLQNTVSCQSLNLIRGEHSLLCSTQTKSHCLPNLTQNAPILKKKLSLPLFLYEYIKHTSLYSEVDCIDNTVNGRYGFTNISQIIC